MADINGRFGAFLACTTVFVTSAGRTATARKFVNPRTSGLIVEIVPRIGLLEI